MNSNKNENSPASSQQNNIVSVLTNTILSLEQNARRQIEQVNNLKVLLRYILNQQSQPQSPKSSRARVSRHDSHRSQPYPSFHANSLHSPLLQRQRAPGVQNIDQFAKQNSFQNHTNTLCLPQLQLQSTPLTPEFSSTEYLSLLQQPMQGTDQLYLMTEQKPSQNHTHNLLQPTAQDTGLLEQQQPVGKFGLGSHYHAQSPLPQQPPNPPPTLVTSPYHNTHNLSSPKQPSVPPVQVTDQFGHVMVGQIPASQQLSSHMILGEAFPFPSGLQPPEFDNNEFK